MPLKSVKFSKTAQRILIILLGFLGVGFIFFSLKWSIGNVVASYSQNKELADFSIKLAPNDPQTHFASAVLHEKTFLPEDLRKSLEEYEKAAALTPYNYLVWLELGKAYERNGFDDKAAAAFKKAEELAPNYSSVKWIFGNFLLRNEKIEDGISKIRFAAETDEIYVSPFIALVWQYYNGEVEKLKEFSMSSNKLKAAAAVFLARQKKFEDSTEIWNSVENTESGDFYKKSGEEIYNELIADKRYRQAIQIKKRQTESPDIEIGKINNGGFEQEIQIEKTDVFNWTIKPGLLPQIFIDDAQKKAGNRSLVFVFNSDKGKEFREVFQTVAVDGSASYRLNFSYKSELKTNTTLKCEITDAGGQTVLTESKPLEANTGWAEISLNFTVPENTQAVMIRISRETCKSVFCPISGKIWFDEFSLSRN